MVMWRVRVAKVLAALVLVASHGGSGHAEPQPPALPSAAADEGEPVMTGAVVETMDASVYTYVLLRGDDGVETWIAGPKAPVKVGDRLSIRGGFEMMDFKSGALGRTFKVLRMVGSLGVKGGAEATGMPPHPTPRPVDAAEPGMRICGGGGSHGGAPVVAAPPPGAIPKASGAEGRTIAEIYADNGTLPGKRVLVRGMVVKAALGILDRNWYHVQDGSGDRAVGTHDLAVTSTEEVKVGDIVLVDGTVTISKDVGEGYKYPVLVEQAHVTVEK